MAIEDVPCSLGSASILPKRLWAPARLGASRLDDDEGVRERGLVGDGQVDKGFGPRRENRFEPLGRASGEPHGRLAGGQIDHSHVAPEHSAAQSRPQRLGAGFLGGKPLGVGGGAPGPRFRPALFGLGEAAIDESPAEAFDRPLDSPYVAEIAADPDDHRRRSVGARPSSIAARIDFTVSARPTKIASPIRKWPMLSSTTCGRPAITRADS